MKFLNVSMWDNEIALISENSNLIYFELQNEKQRCISPLKFEHTTLVKEKESEIDKLGLLADAISGSYGKEYFDKFYFDNYGKKATLLERLSFIGSNAIGAMSFSPSTNSEDVAIQISLLEFKQESINVYEGLESDIAFFIAKSNSGAGGAKAKGIAKYNPSTKEIELSNSITTKENFIHAIIKFNAKTGLEAKKINDELKLEYVYYLLAKESGLDMSDSYLEIDKDDNCYFITKRFDIDANAKEYHVHSLAGIFSHDASSFTMGYELLFRAALMLQVPNDNMLQIYKNMIFNLVYANRDDHSRNFSFLMDENCIWSYAPAYDLTYAGSNVGFSHHQLTIDKKFAKFARALQINKLAKIGNITKPLEIIKKMIEIKHQRLKKLCNEYEIDDVIVKSIFKDTQEIDKRFGDIHD